MFPVFAALMLATFQVAIVFTAEAYLETISEAGARLVLTNQANSMTQSQFQTAICNQVSAMFNCGNLIVALQQAPASASGIAAVMPQFNAMGQLLNPTTYVLAPRRRR